MSLAPGIVIGHYQIVRALGAGGMGEVYLAEDTVLGRRVALKFLPEDLIADENRVRRFEREARTISMLNHPNILTIHELAHQHNYHYIVTEYIEGHTLRERMARPVPVIETLDITTAIVTGLAAAHTSGVIHRDLKPENVMVRTDGLVKLLDFGVASFVEQVGSATVHGETAAHEIVGTLPYMSPEQLRGEPVDARTDVYSLGILLFEMLAGRRPFEPTNKAELIAAILGREPPRLARFALDAPAALDDLVSMMLSKPPVTRPASMVDVLATLVETRRTLDNRPPLVSLTTSLETRAPAFDSATNLPEDFAPLIGRGRELEQLAHLLRDPGVRLVTLTGAGGTGKTRLALACASRAREYFRHGVFLVSLSSLSDAELVIPTVAATLSVKELAGERLTVTVQKRLADRETLLVIDNFEQVIDAAPAIAQLLSGAGHLKILATSQTPLRIRGEREFPVHPLSVPKDRERAEALQLNPAVALFVSRATDVNPDFKLTDQNAAAVQGICIRLGGLPLAIELAAARTKVLSPTAILQKLEAPLAFLRGGARDLPPRQQTMRGAIEWTYALLTPEEQALFRRLASFSGGCTAAAVQQVCAIDMDADSALEHFAGLVDKSLLQGDVSTEPEPRFTMLLTIHSFATELLTASPERQRVRKRHATYFREFAERIEPELYGASSSDQLRMIDLELANIRAAVSWSLEAGDIELGVRLTVALLPFWLRRAHASEGLGHLERLLPASGQLSEEQRLRALYASGVLAEARAHYALARVYFTQHLEIHRRRNDAWGVANALNNLGVISLRENDYVAADGLYRESLAIWQQVKNPPAVALSLQNLGNVARLQKRFEDARALYRDSQSQFCALGDEFGVAKCLNLLGDLAREQGDLEQARQLGEESLQIFMRRTDHREVATCLADLGNVEHDSGKMAEAFALYQESLLILRELGDVVAASRLIDAIVDLVSEQQRHEDALRLGVTAATLRTSAGVALGEPERLRLGRLMESVRAAHGDARANQLWRDAETRSLEDAITLMEQQDFG